MANAVNIEEFWIMHRPRHPIWNTIMFSESGVTPVAPQFGIQTGVTLYSGDEKDYLFYVWTDPTPPNGWYCPALYAVNESAWLRYTVVYSMADAINAVKQLLSYIGQDNIQLLRAVNPQSSSIQY